MTPRYESRNIARPDDALAKWVIFDTRTQAPVEYEGPWVTRTLALRAADRLNNAYLRTKDMLVAEIHIHEGNFMSAAPAVHIIGFEDLDSAYAEYERLVALMRRKEERANDLPKTVECAGTSQRVSIPLDGLRGVGLSDFAKVNKQRVGVKDAYPLIGWTP